MTLSAGRLDRRIRIERRVDETDAAGQSIPRWLPLASVWAKVESLSGRESPGAEEAVATLDVRFVVRWRGDVTPRHRVVFDGRVFDVLSVADDGRREALVIVARARTDTDEALP